MAKKQIERPVYVVMGRCGEYSDRTEWAVAAYENQATAAEHVTLATQAAVECSKVRQRRMEETGYLEVVTEPKNPYDPHMQTDYTGTDYFVVPVPFRALIQKDE